MGVSINDIGSDLIYAQECLQEALEDERLPYTYRIFIDGTLVVEYGGDDGVVRTVKVGITLEEIDETPPTPALMDAYHRLVEGERVIKGATDDEQIIDILKDIRDSIVAGAARPIPDSIPKFYPYVAPSLPQQPYIGDVPRGPYIAGGPYYGTSVTSTFDHQGEKK